MGKPETPLAVTPEQQTLWQALLCRLEGVYAAQAVFSPKGRPMEIHVLATTEKNAKAIARNVQSALMAQFGVEIDHHIISVAQIPPEMHRDAGAKEWPRLVFEGLTVRSMGKRVQATVSLSVDGKTFTGECVGTTVPYNRRCCIAQASLDAVAAACGQAMFDLVSVDLVALGGQNALIAQIYSTQDQKRLLGSAFTGEDPDSAVVHSVLGAINRRVSIALQPCQ